LIIGHWKAIEKWGRISIKLIVVAYFVCLLFIPLSPYPAQEALGLGEPSAYYRIATNFAQGKGFLQDYFVTDSFSNYFYIPQTPFLIFLMSLFLKIFGIGWYPLFVYTCLAGALLFFLFSSYVALPVGRGRPPGKALFLLTLVIMAMPVYFISVGLGIIVLPGALIFLFLAIISMEEDLFSKRLRYLMIGCCLLFLFFIRPEAKFAAVIFFAVYGLTELFRRIGRNAKLVLSAVLLSVAILSWFNLPLIFDTFFKGFRSASLFYNKYDQKEDRFSNMHGSLSMAHVKKTYENIIGRKDFDKLLNFDIGTEIRDHPRAFSKLAADSYLRTSNILAYTFLSPQSFWQGLLETDLALLMIIISLIMCYLYMEKRYRSMVLIFFLYLATIRLLNSWVHIRHLLIISIPLFTLLSRSLLIDLSKICKEKQLLFLERRGLFTLLSILLGGAIVFNCYTLASFRLDQRNRAHLPIIKAIEEQTTENDTLLSNAPTLMTSMTGRYCIGVMDIVRFLPLIVNYLKPDAIIIDNARRDGPRNYTLYTGLERGVEGYKVVIHDKSKEFILLKKACK